MDVAGWTNIQKNAVVTGSLFNVDMNRQKSITDIGSDIIINNYQIEEKTETPIKDNFSETVFDKEDSLAISNFASNLSVMDKRLKDAGNTKGVDGLREVAKHFAKNTGEFANFMNSVNKMDENSFQKFFATVDKITDKDLKLDDFIDNTSSTLNANQVKSTIDSTNQIINDAKANDVDIKTVFNKLMSGIKNIENSNLSQVDKDSKFTNFFTAITKGKNVLDIGITIDNFNK